MQNQIFRKHRIKRIETYLYYPVSNVKQDDEMNNIPVKKIMTTPVITIREDESISNFIELILKNGINGLPVVNSEGNLTGIATRTDLLAFELKRELSTLYEKKLHDIFNKYKKSGEWTSFIDIDGQHHRTIIVKDIMVTDLITVGENTPVKNICSIMANNKISHIIITNNGKLSGIVTSRDIIGLVAGEE